MVNEDAEFEKWLGQVSDDMYESVESVVDVEADLVAFKQKVYAQAAAIAHADGNDAPDEAVRSVLAPVVVSLTEGGRANGMLPGLERSLIIPIDFYVRTSQITRDLGKPYDSQSPSRAYVSRSYLSRLRRASTALHWLMMVVVLATGAIAVVTSVGDDRASVLSLALPMVAAVTAATGAMLSMRIRRRLAGEIEQCSRATTPVVRVSRAQPPSMQCGSFEHDALCDVGPVIDFCCDPADSRAIGDDTAEGEEQSDDKEALVLSAVGHSSGALLVRSSSRRRRADAVPRRPSRTRPAAPGMNVQRWR